MKLIELKNNKNEIIFSYESENNSVKETLLKAIEIKIDLININLSNSYLSNIYLKNVNLSGANLKNANLSGANLKNTNLVGANLTNTRLLNTNLFDVNLTGANLTGANLTGANLTGANLTNTRLLNTNLFDVNLTGANLTGANLTGANLTNTILSSVNIPIYCKWAYSININKQTIKIGCEEKTIKEWDEFFASNNIIKTERNTENFINIQATYEACKSYLLFKINNKIKNKIKMFKIIKKENLSEIDLKFIEQSEEIRNLSIAEDKKVGSIIGNHKTGKLLTIGFNKMFDELGFTNCEDETGQSLPYVIHAEEVAVIEFLKRNLHKTNNVKDLTIYCSYAPCINCSKYISHIGIKRIVYSDKHKLKFDNCKHSPLEFLLNMNCEIIEVLN